MKPNIDNRDVIVSIGERETVRVTELNPGDFLPGYGVVSSAPEELEGSSKTIRFRYMWRGVERSWVGPKNVTFFRASQHWLRSDAAKIAGYSTGTYGEAHAARLVLTEQAQTLRDQAAALIKTAETFETLATLV